MIGDLLAGLIGGALGGAFYGKSRRRSLARADAAGRPLQFPGSVLGQASYCHPAGGILRLEGTTLTWLTGKGGKSFPLPAERLQVHELGDVRASEAFPGGKNVAVVCDDNGVTVRIVVLASDLPYLARALPGTARWLGPVSH